jgi:molybdopterin molybdotransferase
LATGDELVRPGAPRGATQIVAASLDGLLAQIEAWGGEPYDLGLAPDRLETIAAALGAADADMAVTLGGASAGEHDLVRQALSAAGVALDFWRIAMRPGKPMMFGRSGSRLYLGLPGNPVSALVCALLFLKPALGRMHGADESPLRLRRAAMSVAMGPNDAREDYVRASLDPDGRVMPFPVQDSGQLRPLAHASVLLVRPAHAPALAPGDAVDVIELSAD